MNLTQKRKRDRRKYKSEGRKFVKRIRGSPKIFLAKISTRQNQKEECRYK